MSLRSHMILSAVIRTTMIAYGDWHDLVMEVKYTDIDYNVVSDGALFMFNGTSPYLRHTYRYTPLLAVLMFGNIFINKVFGKIVFAIFDILTAVVIYKLAKILQNNDKRDKLTPLCCACLWFYNPFAIVICTRGNSDSIMTLLTLLTVYFLLKRQIILSSIVFGFSIHFKIYPVIYSLAMYLTLNDDKRKCLKQLLIPNIKSFRYFGIAFISFAIPSVLSYYFYGHEYLNEAFLYHLTRKDIRHNFSPYFYYIYLSDLNENSLFNYLIFLPQIVLFVVFAIRYHGLADLPFCFFSTTFTFVMFNKVCTSQYFLWFMCHAPVFLPQLSLSLFKGAKLCIVWVFGQALWLLFAYYLEFKCVNTYIYIFLASLIFFVINIWLLKSLVNSYEVRKIKTN